MPGTNHIPGEEPIQPELPGGDPVPGLIPEEDNGSGSIKKPDMPVDGPRGGEINAAGAAATT